MGQHKYNPRAKKAAMGKMPPKKKAESMRQQNAYLNALVASKMPQLPLERKYQ
jgi:hypothetical protein